MTARRQILAVLLIICCALPGRADETYTFNGPTYSVFAIEPSCSELPFPCPSTQAHITGWLTTNLSLIALVNLNQFQIPSSDITAFSFTDNDGISVNNSNATAWGFDISTNSRGQITGPAPWGFFAGGPSGELGAADIGEDWSQTNTTYGQTPFEPFGNEWSGPVYSPEPRAPVPTPEPSTAAMLVTAMIAILIKARGETGGGQSENETGRGAARKARGGTT
jgi:hypothetical protein